MISEFSQALISKKQAGFIPVIPDIKCNSPKEGDLLRGRDPLAMAKLLEEAGAPALSVVTEQKYFGGSIKLLEKIATVTTLPLLRKDFISNIDDLKITKDCGAAAILLICAKLPFAKLAKLYEQAIQIGLEPLVEVHSTEELTFAANIGATLIGINNRDITNLEKDDGTVSVTKSLAINKPQNALLVSESAIQTPAEARAAIDAGADAVLIGTAIWQADDMHKCFLAFSKIGDII